jgi:uncharacterized protein (DUF488 family)
MTTTICTIGHSSHNWPTFQRLLDQAAVGVVVDVRSNPASRLQHFSRTTLKERLNTAGIGYIFAGLELGGRPRGSGIADYEQIAASPLFAEGIARVQEIATRTRPALMCSEHEPLTCHRCLLVGRRLAERSNTVAHILRDGTIEPNEVTEDRLLALTRKTDADLFAPRSERLARAYRNQAMRITTARSLRRTAHTR